MRATIPIMSKGHPMNAPLSPKIHSNDNVIISRIVLPR